MSPNFEFNFKRIASITVFVLIAGVNVFSQDVLMQGWFWDYPKTAQSANWTDTLNTKIADLAEKGITHMWLPPFTRSSFGSGSNGYDPKDLYDLGEYGLGPTGFGTRSQLDNLISTIQSNGMKAVADVVYNHRDGGSPETNSAVEGWIENYNCTKRNNGDNPFPSDRYRIILPLGGSTGNGAGTYYFKIASASKHPDFYNAGYKFYAQTNTTGFQNLPAQTESEPNGGGDCGQGNNTVQLGVDFNAFIDSYGSDCFTGSCGADEFALTIGAGKFNPAGDTLYIFMNNTSGGYTDHFIYGLWSGARGMDIQGELKYQTYTDFTSMPSGRGEMNYLNFKPNGNPTNLGGDWDAMLFFYDYDQSVSGTRDTLINWTKWLIDSVHMEGLRMDAVKHFDYAFTAALVDELNSSGKNPGLIVGESFDFSADVLKSWVDNVENAMTTTTKNVRVFDFALRSALKSASDQFGYDVRNVFNAGIVNGAGGLADQSVTFVNNHDFRGTDEHVLNNPQLAYCYILTNPTVGLPTIFYPDYFGTDLPEGPDAYLKDEIDILLNIKTNFINGTTQTNYISNFGSPTSINFNSGFASTSLIYQSADPAQSIESLVAINYAGDTMDVSFVWPKMLGSSNLLLIDKTGRSLTPIVIPEVDNTIRLMVPPQSYAVWTTSDVAFDCVFSDTLYVDLNAAGSNSGKNWTNAMTSLNSAIALTKVCPNIQEIWVKEGTYKSNFTDKRESNFNLDSQIKLYGGFPTVGNPEMDDRDWLNNPTVLSGDIGASSQTLDNTYHVLSCLSTMDTVFVDGFTISGGQADGSSEFAKGGGIYNLGVLSLKNVLIESNLADEQGRAIYNDDAATLIMEAVQVLNNSGSSEDLFIGGNGVVRLKGAMNIQN